MEQCDSCRDFTVSNLIEETGGIRFVTTLTLIFSSKDPDGSTQPEHHHLNPQYEWRNIPPYPHRILRSCRVALVSGTSFIEEKYPTVPLRGTDIKLKVLRCPVDNIWDKMTVPSTLSFFYSLNKPQFVDRGLKCPSTHLGHTDLRFGSLKGKTTHNHVRTARAVHQDRPPPGVFLV